MADKKISALTAATTPLAGTEVLPIVQSGSTVKVAVSDLTAGRAVSASTISATGASAGTTVATFNGVYSGGGSVVLSQWQRNGGAIAAAIFYDDNLTSINFGTTTNHELRIYANNAEAAQFFPSGGVSIGSSNSDPSAGNLAISNGNLVIGTSGKGIDFSATSGAGTSELFSDYEEGTWTPTNSSAITVNSAKYTKIGRIVICTFDITVGASATTGDMLGLPFNATNPTSGGVLSYHNENGTETWSVSIEASGAPNWSFRLGSTQKQLSAGKNAKGMITYSL